MTFRLDGSARYRYHRTPWEKALPEPGAFVTVRVREVPTESGTRFDAVSMQPSDVPPDESFAREFTGELKLIPKPGKDPIGFAKEVFVPGALLRTTSLVNGDQIAGIAVKEMNRAKGEHGWRAVCVRKGGETEGNRQ